MKAINGGTQMKDVWNLSAIAPWEKYCSKHPTQKPLALLTQIILASTEKSAWVLDPFTGSSTTGIAANLANRKTYCSSEVLTSGKGSTQACLQ